VDAVLLQKALTLVALLAGSVAYAALIRSRANTRSTAQMTQDAALRGLVRMFAEDEARRVGRPDKRARPRQD
jgi:hypothetical protein